MSETQPMSTPEAQTLDTSDNSLVFFCPLVGLAIISTFFVGLRLCARRVQGVKYGLDDYMAIIALVCDWSVVGSTWAAIAGGAGRHVNYVLAMHPGGLEPFLKALFAMEITYALSSTASRAALVALYYKVFYLSASFRRAAWVMAAMLIAWTLAALLTSIFSCIPIEGFWDKSLKSTCINNIAFSEYISYPNILLDIASAVLPIREIWRLQLSRNRKLTMVAMFGLGIFVALATTARLLCIKFFLEGHQNPTQEIASFWLSAALEVNIPLIGACLPPIRPLWANTFGRTKDQNTKDTCPRSLVTIGQKSTRHQHRTYSCFNLDVMLNESFEWSNVATPATLELVEPTLVETEVSSVRYHENA